MTKIELFKFFRSVKLKAFFAKDRTITTEGQRIAEQQRRFKPKSTFMPPAFNPSVQTFCRLVDQEVSSLFSSTRDTRFYPNLSTHERASLRTLQEDDSIVIKPADKGGAIVIQDSETYRLEIKRQLDDTEFYTALTTDPTIRFQSRIKRTLNTALTSGEINKEEFDFLYQEHPIRAVFYTLPKVHKKSGDHIPGRPIVAGCQSLTEPISQYVDYYIKPLVCSLPSYLKDTTDFLNKLQRIIICDTDLLCTIDVTSLYTNIPHDLGLDALEHYLTSRENSHPPTKLLWDLAHIILTMNTFLFEDTFYHQTKGTAMGSPFAPNYANLFMGKFEEDFVYNNNEFSQYLKCFFRYIDDCFFVFSGSVDMLHAFHGYLNTRLDSIKFSLEFNIDTIPFLDVQVNRSGSKLETSVYRKATDRNSLLMHSSYHPPSMKKSLPYSQFLRVRRICSTDNEFENQAKVVYDRFINKGYDTDNLNTCLLKARESTRCTLLEKQVHKSDEQRIALVNTFSPFSNDIKHIVKKYWHILSSDPTVGHSFFSPPRFAYKRQNNLRDSLVKADTYTPPHNWLRDLPPGNFPCHNCVNCNAMIKGDTFFHPRTGKVFKVKGRITCRTASVVYMLKCPCGLCYVGKTNRELRLRITEHKSSIRRKCETSPVARHFNIMGHDICSLRFQGLELVNQHRRGGDRERTLLQREAFWIFTLQTVHPSGLNEELELNSFL
ncbi:hypothetical protein ACEWY4_010171 [Coilia grayii]|uniref:Reverse transcriptase domain-containing protein n=1 Tax=Coilia grayii TaxID=363190 RepID=A0ABD1K8H9_9TELE